MIDKQKNILDEWGLDRVLTEVIEWIEAKKSHDPYIETVINQLKATLLIYRSRY